ncbi:MAG: hypothetical protein H6624_00900 [Bdellovibrionaceae bacterium]|nr:hypothetical protein [Bdellovibrionales bacterium]MCB9082866.1 hypothetical protein [Pseudobdellovibrionaceae bacterium]
MVGRFCYIILLLVSLLTIAPHEAGAVQGKVLTATVGHVSDEVVTSREVQINYLVEKALYGKGRSNRSIPPLEWGHKNFPREVNGVLLEWVVHLEAKNFAATKVTSLDVDKAEKTVREKLRSHSQWAQLGVTRKELRLLLDRKIRAKNFIQFKAQTSVVPVTDDEAQDYFEKNRLKFGNFPFDKFKSNIKSFLSRQQVDRRLKDWFEVLQAKYKVRNLLVEM